LRILIRKKILAYGVAFAQFRPITKKDCFMKKLLLFLQKSFTIKIFLGTSAMLAFTTAILYGVIFFVMPIYYADYREKQVTNGFHQLREEVEQTTLLKSTDKLEAFAINYNVKFRIVDDDGKVVFEPERFVTVTEGEAHIDKKTPVSNFDMYEYTDRISDVATRSLAMSSWPIYFTDGQYLFEGTATLQPITEVSIILLKFTPYFIAFYVLVAIIAGFIFSRMISRPLLQMNDAATKMAELDFSTQIPVYSDDEIGQLSNKFNQLSRNLATALTDLQIANEHLQEDIEKERKIEEKRREFVATVSHELKSPITAVKGQLEGMIHGIGVYKDTDKYLRRSFAKLEEMESLVKEMLEVSRLDRPDFKPNARAFSLRELVAGTLNKLDFFIREKKMNLQVDLLPDVVINSDDNMLSKVVHNVVHNAIAYSKEAETLSVRLEDTGDQYVLTILNTGAALEIENMADLFRPFYRLDKSRNRNAGGSGLGLYIVKQFLDALHIKFNMENTAAGVAFTMYFEKMEDESVVT